MVFAIGAVFATGDEAFFLGGTDGAVRFTGTGGAAFAIGDGAFFRGGNDGAIRFTGTVGAAFVTGDGNCFGNDGAVRFTGTGGAAFVTGDGAFFFGGNDGAVRFTGTGGGAVFFTGDGPVALLLDDAATGETLLPADVVAESGDVFTTPDVRLMKRVLKLPPVELGATICGWLSATFFFATEDADWYSRPTTSVVAPSSGPWSNAEFCTGCVSSFKVYPSRPSLICS